jgi:alanine racemase
MRNCSVLVHLGNFRRNLREIRRFLGPGVKISTSVKADAYGHGAVPIAEAAQAEGADYLGIASPREGGELREAGISLPLLLYGLCLPEEMSPLVDLDISAVVSDREGAEEFARIAARRKKRARLHLMIDTGMGRIGCRPEEAAGLAKIIASSSHLLLEGVATHFPSADEENAEFTGNQITVFRKIIDRIRALGVDPGIIHASNSAGLLRFPEANFSMVRPGVLLYGYLPSRHVGNPFPLHPVMELRAPVLLLKKVPRDTPISYGNTFRTETETIIGTIGAGYADGYPRSLSNRGKVLIGKRTYPVVGRVTMDQIMVDLGPETDIRRYDTAVLFGPDPLGPSAEDVAALASTISYEITCGINRRVPRTYTED